MRRFWCVAAAVAVMGGATLMLPSSGADDKKEPTIKEIMTKAHKGGNSLIQEVAKDLKQKQPDWADVQEKSKELVSLGTSLGKNTPPKGDQASWDKLTQQYLVNAKALEDAAENKDQAAALAAHKKLTTMCAACHKAHKPPS